MLSGLELKAVSELVGVVRDEGCPCCGDGWRLTFAGRDVDRLGSIFMVARAVCPGCGAELEVGRYLFDRDISQKLQASRVSE